MERNRTWKLIFWSGLGILSCFLLKPEFALGKSPSSNVVCDQEYVLCTSAPCIPDPTDPENKSICQCNVQTGKSYGHTSCDSRKPRDAAGGAKVLISTYSFEQAPTMKIMKCPAGNSWSDCLDQPCTVDPMDTKRAICSCKVVRTGGFVTYGGSCDTGSCGLGYWSGATDSSYRSASKYFATQLGVASLPMSYCPK